MSKDFNKIDKRSYPLERYHNRVEILILFCTVNNFTNQMAILDYNSKSYKMLTFLLLLSLCSFFMVQSVVKSILREQICHQVIKKKSSCHHNTPCIVTKKIFHHHPENCVLRLSSFSLRNQFQIIRHVSLVWSGNILIFGLSH